MNIQKTGGMRFRIRGSQINSFVDLDGKISKCKIPLSDFKKVDYRELTQRENIKKGDILLNTDQKLLLSPISGKLSLNKDDILEIEAIFKDEQVSDESLELLKKEDTISLLKKLELIERKDLNRVKRIIVNLTHTEPFLVKDTYLLNRFESSLNASLKMLVELFPSKESQIVYSNPECESFLSITSWDTFKIKDIYPFDDEKLVVSRLTNQKISDVNLEETLFVPVEKLIVIYNYIKKNVPPTYRYLSIAGNIKKPSLVKAPVFSDLEKLVSFFHDDSEKEKIEYIIGGVFKGRLSKDDPYIYSNDLSVTILESNRPRMLWSFMRPGAEEHSNSRAFLSSYLPGEKIIDDKLHGEERACVFCGFCESVCPARIIPFVLSKHVEIDELEDAKRFRIMDCIDCGLCTHVCPSKIDLAYIIEQGKKNIIKEKI